MSATKDTLENFKSQIENCFFTAKGDQEKLLNLINEIIDFIDDDATLSQQPNSLNDYHKTLASNNRANKDVLRLAFRDCKSSCLDELDTLLVGVE